MSEISLNKIKYFAYKMDTSQYGNNDGKIDKQEAARIALLLKDTPGLQDVAQFYATTVLGGSDGQGLFPDADGDGKLNAADLNALAAKSGSAQGIGFEDLKAQFGDRATASQTISLQALKDLAALPSTTPTPTPATETDGVATDKLIYFAAQLDNSIYGNKDGKIDKKEAARMVMLLSDNTQHQDVAKFWATTLLGGTDGAGLLPDTDGDGSLNRSEISALAAKVGSAGKLSVEDFKAQFGDRAGAGQTLSLGAIYEQAHFEEVKAPQPSGISNTVNAFIGRLLQALLGGVGVPQDPSATA